MSKKNAKTNDFPKIEDTPVITEAVALATLNDEAVEEPVVSGEFSEPPPVSNDFVAEGAEQFPETDSINEIDDGSSDDDEAGKPEPASEHPTVDEAREMFEGNPGLAEVLTDLGWVRRVDVLGGKKLGLDGLYR